MFLIPWKEKNKMVDDSTPEAEKRLKKSKKLGSQVGSEVEMGGTIQCSNKIAKEKSKRWLKEIASKDRILSEDMDTSFSSGLIKGSLTKHLSSPKSNNAHPLNPPPMVNEIPHRNTSTPPSPHTQQVKSPYIEHATMLVARNGMFKGSIKKKFTKLDNEILGLKHDMKEIKTHIVDSNKFSLKVMYVLMVTLCNV